MTIKGEDMEKIDFDAKIIKILQKIPGVHIENYSDYSTEMNHFLLHAVICFLLLSFPISPYFALISLVLALLKELLNDSVWKGWPVHDRSNLIFRCSGALLPFLTLLWR